MMKIQRTEKQNGTTSYPLSASQEQLWFLNQLAPGSPVYNVVDLVDLGATYDPQILRKVALELVHRHETLRTAFSYVDGQPMQTVLPSAELEILEFDLAQLPETARESEWARVINEQTRRPFDLSQAPLIRWTVIHRSSQEHKLLVVLHHIITDEWGTGILHGEIAGLYKAFSRGESSSLSELPIQYVDFAYWQKNLMQGEVLEKQLAYWKSELAGAPQVLDLATDKSRPAIQSFRGTWETLSLPSGVLAPLKALSRKERTTLFTTLLAGFMTLMYRYTGQDDILAGTPISLRRLSETENLVGYFLNTVIVRAQFEQGLSFRSLLQQVRKRMLGAITNAELPLNLLVAELAPERDLSRMPLFQVAFIFHDPEGVSEISKASNAKQLGTGSSKFDLTLHVSELKDGLDVSIEYCTDLFEAPTICRMLKHFGTLLEAVGSNPDESVTKLAVLDDSELRQLLVDWNATTSGYPQEVSLSELVESQVRRAPGAIAVVYRDRQLTYRELNTRANRLAHELRKHGAGPDGLVGLFVERSTDLVVSLLAIVKTGAAYLPLDPLFPADRLSYMLEDSGARLLITQQSLRGALTDFSGTTILLEDQGWHANCDENLAISVGSEHLAYLIYTSGSTGKPKGVQIRRGAFTNFLWSMREWLQLNEQDRLLAVTTISFDIAGLEMWLPLLVGAQIVVASHESAADGHELRSLLKQHDITFLQATPVTWRLLFGSGWTGKPNLQAVCGGEAMPPEVATQLVPAVKRLWNLYGPTETTVWSTGYEVTDSTKPILIGRPLANTQCYILDKQRQPVPVGVIGELYIGGDGLARGYLNRPELTAEKFVADPFRGGDARMYRTGDLARYQPDGNIECLGRIDHQVKIRGYRIELGEIEAQLKDWPDIGEAVVIVREDTPGNKRLVAYYTVPKDRENAAETINVAQLRAHLSINLPDYMIPSAYVRMDAMPLTPNGKLDRKALPTPDSDSYSTHSYEPPRGEIEMKLAAVWAEVLKLDRIGRHDNFFDIGGHSLLAVQLMLRVQELFQGEVLPVRAILEAPTLEGFAAWLQAPKTNQSQILVRMRQGSSTRPPLFCVTGVGGNPISLHTLAQAAPPDLSFYALQAKGLDGSEPFHSVEEAASCYLDEIRKVQPRGPYYLAGSCYGGLAAYEMACMLDEMGETVGALLLIDTYNSVYFSTMSTRELLYRHARYYLRRASVHVHQFFSIRPGEWVGYMAGRLRAVFKHMQNIEKVALHSKDVKFPFTDATTEIPPPAPGTDLRAILDRVDQVNKVNRDKFVPKPYRGKVVIFRPDERNLMPSEDEFLGWSKLVSGGIESFEIEGSHDAMFQDYAVGQRLFELIDSKLKEATREIDEASELCAVAR